MAELGSSMALIYITSNTCRHHYEICPWRCPNSPVLKDLLHISLLNHHQTRHTITCHTITHHTITGHTVTCHANTSHNHTSHNHMSQTFLTVILMLVWVLAWLLNKPRATHIHWDFPFITLLAELTFYLALVSRVGLQRLCLFIQLGKLFV